MSREHEPLPLDPEKLEKLMRDRFERPLPKRFYKAVTVMETDGEFGIALDGRALRTPLKAPLKLSLRKLAEAIAQEWESQLEVINPARMPLTKLANTTIDRVSPERPRILAEIHGFAAADLLFYRAEAPEGLVALENRHWNPVLEWAAGLGARFVTVQGIRHQSQPEAALAAFARHLESFPDAALCAIHNLSSLTGSALLAVALASGTLGPQAVWDAAHVDEDWQVSQWGEDAEASARRAARRREFDAIVAYLELSR